MTEVDNNRIKVTSSISCIDKVQDKNEETEEIVEENKEIYSFVNNNEIQIRDSETKIDLSLDKTEWTNSIQNDVIMTAILVTNNVRYSLFKNPVIEIKLPSEVEKVILGDVSALYDDNLKIKSAEVIEKDGCKVIKIEVDGSQKGYIERCTYCDSCYCYSKERYISDYDKFICYIFK